MSTHVCRSRVVTALGLLVAVLSACDDASFNPVEPDFAIVAEQGDGRAFRVYTQNVYLGGETAPLFSLDLSDIPALLQATSVFWAQVQASDIPNRAEAIVERISLERPHVVALQEVLRFAVLDAAFQPIGGLDLLGAIETAIAARGLPYETSIVRPTTTSALPLATDGVSITQWLAFTDRLVTLRRTDVELVETDAGLYSAGIPLAPGLTIRRGWTRAKVDFAGTSYHVFNTHLETQSAFPVQAAQAAELIGSVIAGHAGVTIIAGDLNSNAAAGPSDPTWTPTYESLLAEGFIDAWTTAPHAATDAGLTCCHDPSLTGESNFTQRIDFVLVRSSDHDADVWRLRRGTFRAEVVGEEPFDRTGSGLWPSDHAGLVATLRFPSWVADEPQATHLP